MAELFSFPVFSWWLLFLIGGVVSLPLNLKIFKDCSDSAYPLAKIVFLVTLSYPIWLLSSLRLLPFASTPNWIQISLFLLLIFLVLSTTIPILRYSRVPEWVKPTKKLGVVIFEELLFTLAFFFWLYVRSNEPSLASLEKPMDFGIINSILRSDYFPPKDMWLSGFNLNYYYYGHFVTTLLIKLSGVQPEIGYNLMLATLFALTFTSAFSIGLNLIVYAARQSSPSKNSGTLEYRSGRKTVTTLATGLFGLLAAAFVSLFGNLHPVFAYLKSSASYWYPDATRFIPRTIHEFPIYSFVVADLHGHVLDIPFVLLTFFLVFNVWIEVRQQLNLNKVFGKLVFLGALSGILYMTNSLDAIIYLALFGFLILYEIFQKGTTILSGTLVRRLADWSKVVLIVGGSFLISSLPFLLTFKPFINGVGFAPERSPLWQLIILWGGYLPFTLGFLYYFRKLPEPKKGIDIFAIATILTAILLVVFPEIFYFKDIYLTQPRANTMFKFSYQAFIILSLITPYAFYRIVTAMTKKTLIKIGWILAFSIVVVISGAYPAYAIKGYYGNLSGNVNLNGLSYLGKKYPSDYSAVMWLKSNVSGQPVITEAIGESYTEYARVSANTGLSTVFGWPVHEWLWRKSNNYSTERSPDIEKIYTSSDVLETQRLLNKYGVKYVFVGELERKKYIVNESKFDQLGTPVFSSSTTRIYQIP